MKRMILSSSELITVDSEGNEVPEGMNRILRQSKIRNRKGQLRVCYHGTDSEFTEFKEEFISTNSGNIGWCGKKQKAKYKSYIFLIEIDLVFYTLYSISVTID